MWTRRTKAREVSPRPSGLCSNTVHHVSLCPFVRAASWHVERPLAWLVTPVGRFLGLVLRGFDVKKTFLIKHSASIESFSMMARKLSTKMFQIEPMHCVLMTSPICFVGDHPCFMNFTRWNFAGLVHRIRCREEACSPYSISTCSSNV